jgi:hypothetical protein
MFAPNSVLMDHESLSQTLARHLLHLMFVGIGQSFNMHHNVQYSQYNTLAEMDRFIIRLDNVRRKSQLSLVEMV